MNTNGVTRGIDVADANAARQASPTARFLISTGPPGCDKDGSGSSICTSVGFEWRQGPYWLPRRCSRGHVR
eukprot:1662863-Karenia_brevis.AAC.1